MTLKKLIREEDKSVEKYSIKAPFMKSCKIPEGYSNIIGAVSSKLEDYCVFKEMGQVINLNKNIMGGPIPNRIWCAVIKAEDDCKIDITVSQSYEQPLGYLSGAKAEIKYGNTISEKDINIIRETLTSSGLEKIN